MRARLNTIVVIAVVGGVVAAAAIDALTAGRTRPHPPAASASSPTRTTFSRAAPGPASPGSAIVFGGRVGSRRRLPGQLVVTPGQPAVQTVDVGVRRPGATGGPVRVVARRLRLGPGVGTPSGERIAVWASNPSLPAADGIYSRDAGGGALERLTDARRGTVEEPLAFSPDGSLLLYYEAPPGRRAGGLHIVHANGTGRTRLTPPGTTSWCCGLGSPATWSPGGQIAFAAFAPGAAGRRGRSAVYVAGPNGTPVRRITPITRFTTTARWSPDGRWIAFDQVDRPGGAHDLFLVHPDGSGLHRLPTASGATGSCCAEWSADSRALVYASGPSNADTSLWMVNIDGSGVRRLTRDGVSGELR
jgi:WD40-like Beta Propeller Repeat